MALLFGLHSLGYRKLVVCHLNHHLRGMAAKADSHLAGTVAQKLGLGFELGEAHVRQHASKEKLSLRRRHEICAMRSSEAVHETIDVRGSFSATMLMTRSKRASSIFCAEAEQLDSEG